jgi:aryl-alcohol dehydrogenase-like predicted oxidoreductase
MGLGAWAWGDRVFWGFNRGYGEKDVQAAFESSLAAGINFIDTAEVYGSGVSERLLGCFLNNSSRGSPSQPLVVATKFFPFPWRFFEKSVTSALQRSLNRLQLEQVDLYQVHTPTSLIPVETWARGLGRAVKEGLTRSVGVSNYSPEQTRNAHSALEWMGVPLAANQVEYSLLNRKIEKTGLVDLCRSLGVAIISYSPIAKGVLTGKYTPASPPAGVRGRFYNREYLEKVQPLLKLLREIGQGHGSKSPSQVAINWAICKGTVPIPGAKNARQAQENAGALGWSLAEPEIEALDRASEGFR